MCEVYPFSEDSYFFSEILKKQLTKKLRVSDLKFLEMGCGGGINLQTAFNAGIKKQNIFACDINLNAVDYCRKLGFNCMKSNLFENIKSKFDLIIFNPPYLPEDKREPRDSRLATTGGKKGSEIVNKFLKQAKFHLTDKGKIFLITSSLTKGIKWLNYKKILLAKKKLFFEEIYVWELTGK